MGSESLPPLTPEQMALRRSVDLRRYCGEKGRASVGPRSSECADESVRRIDEGCGLRGPRCDRLLGVSVLGEHRAYRSVNPVRPRARFSTTGDEANTCPYEPESDVSEGTRTPTVPRAFDLVDGEDRVHGNAHSAALNQLSAIANCHQEPCGPHSILRQGPPTGTGTRSISVDVLGSRNTKSTFILPEAWTNSNLPVTNKGTLYVHHRVTTHWGCQL